MNKYESEAARMGGVVLGYKICPACHVVDKDGNRNAYGYKCTKCGVPGKGGKSFYGFAAIAIVDMIIEPYYSMVENTSAQDQSKMRARYLGSLVFFCTDQVAESLQKSDPAVQQAMRAEDQRRTVQYQAEARTSQTRSTGSSAREQVLGTWNDYQNEYWNLDIAILKKGNSYRALITFRVKDESTKKSYVLVPMGDNAFRREDSSDYYKIESDGTLGLYDDDGFIRKARRI